MQRKWSRNVELVKFRLDWRGASDRWRESGWEHQPSSESSHLLAFIMTESTRTGFPLDRQGYSQGETWSYMSLRWQFSCIDVSWTFPSECLSDRVGTHVSPFSFAGDCPITGNQPAGASVERSGPTPLEKSPRLPASDAVSSLQFHGVACCKHHSLLLAASCPSHFGLPNLNSLDHSFVVSRIIS